MPEKLRLHESNYKLRAQLSMRVQVSFGLRVWPGSWSGSSDAVICCPAEVSLLLFQVPFNVGGVTNREKQQITLRAPLSRGTGAGD